MVTTLFTLLMDVNFFNKYNFLIKPLSQNLYEKKTFNISKGAKQSLACSTFFFLPISVPGSCFLSDYYANLVMHHHVRTRLNYKQRSNLKCSSALELECLFVVLATNK